MCLIVIFCVTKTGSPHKTYLVCSAIQCLSPGKARRRLVAKLPKHYFCSKEQRTDRSRVVTLAYLAEIFSRINSGGLSTQEKESLQLMKQFKFQSRIRILENFYFPPMSLTGSQYRQIFLMRSMVILRK